MVREAEIPSGVGRGWWPIIEELQEQLDSISPGWQPIQVKEKFGCYDAATEVLTAGGWMNFSDLKGNEEFATLAEGERLEYQAATDHFAAAYQGPMYRLKTRGVDLLVTPNHRLLVAKGTYWNGRHSPPKKVERPLELVTPDVYFGKNKRFLKAACWSGAEPDHFEIPASERARPWSKDDPTRLRIYRRPAIEVPIEPWLEFLGWFIAEGCVSREESRRSDVAISANNTDSGEERAVQEQIYEQLPWRFRVSKVDESACTYTVTDLQLGSWLREHVGCGAENKRIPRFVGELSPRLIKLLLEALFQGDGHKSKTAHILTTVSRGLADDVQELILKAGGSSRIYKTRSPRSKVMPSTGKTISANFPVFEVNWMPSLDHCTQLKGLAESSSESWDEHDGMVYCVTVPNGILFVRRNGIPVWCGNSLRTYVSPSEPERSEIDLGDGKTLPVIDEGAAADEEIRAAFDAAIREAEKLSAVTCEECGAPGRLVRNDPGWFRTLCETCAGDEFRPPVPIPPRP
jgi:replicative DNA helicase Mcm